MLNYVFDLVVAGMVGFVVGVLTVYGLWLANHGAPRRKRVQRDDSQEDS